MSDVDEDKEISSSSKSIVGEVTSNSECATRNEYSLINNVYYYTDISTGKHFKHDSSANEWVEVLGDDVPEGLVSRNGEAQRVETEKVQKITSSVEVGTSKEHSSSVTVDEEGRQFYQADGYYLCRDVAGHVYFMDENNAWQPWEAKGSEGKKQDKRWYFYKGGDTLYRDSETAKVYKLNKETNEWGPYINKRKKSRRRTEEEEFDTDEEEISEDDEVEIEGGSLPLGVGSDPNIHFDGNTYTKIDPTDNVTYEWDATKRAWFPKVDEDFMASYQLSYGFNPDGTQNENPLRFDDDEEEDENPPPKEEDKSEKKKPSWFEVEDQHNTKVYVTDLPEDITEQEFVDLMQKCGLVLKDPEKNEFKIKLYKDADGKFKREALCTYIRIESVDLALQILDGYRIKNNTIKVERAKFAMKGSYNPTLKPRKKRKKDQEKLQKKQDKLLDWRPEPMRGQRAKNENTAIIRNVFDATEFDTAAERILVHQQAIEAQCQSFGQVKKVEVFDRHKEGIVKVTFAEVESADLCIATLNNRLYLKRKLSVSVWDGKEKYNIEETEEQRMERLKKWEAFLEEKKT